MIKIIECCRIAANRLTIVGPNQEMTERTNKPWFQQHLSFLWQRRGKDAGKIEENLTTVDKKGGKYKWWATGDEQRKQHDKPWGGNCWKK
jgi:hypothetical protein